MIDESKEPMTEARIDRRSVLESDPVLLPSKTEQGISVCFGASDFNGGCIGKEKGAQRTAEESGRSRRKGSRAGVFPRCGAAMALVGHYSIGWMDEAERGSEGSAWKTAISGIGAKAH